MTPNCVDLDSFGDQCSADYQTTVTEPGFSVTVEDEDSEPSEPVEVTEESLDEMQKGLEAADEEPEDSSTTEAESENLKILHHLSQESQLKRILLHLKMLKNLKMKIQMKTLESDSAPISSDESEDNAEPFEGNTS